MSREDEAIERVLMALGQAEVPDGLELRVLAAMRERADAGAAKGSVWGVRVWAAAVGVVVVLAMVWVSAVRHGREVEGKKDAVVTVPRVSPMPVPSVEVARKEVARRVGPQRVARKVEVKDAEEELAMSEMRAPSQVAPGLPLTEQERMLRRLVHKGDPEEVAMLNPATRAERNAAERAQVQHFFDRANGVSE